MNIKKQGRIKRIFKIIALIVIGLAVSGFIFEQIAEQIDRSTLHAPGQLVTVGDHLMHIYCTGENKNNSPTVILEAGGGSFWTEWSKVQPEISKLTKVCSYDRSGSGFSGVAHDKRSNIEVVQELEKLLENSNIKGPYILAGHSIGGFYIRVFASRHLSDIKGLVFIDSSHEDQEKVAKLTFFDKAYDTVLWNVYRAAFNLGVARILITVSPEAYGIAKEDLPYSRALILSQSFDQATDAIESAINSSEQVKAARNFGNIPIRVLTADESLASIYGPIILGFQKDIAGLSTDGEQKTVPHTSHMIPVDQPQAVIDTISTLLNQK